MEKYWSLTIISFNCFVLWPDAQIYAASLIIDRKIGRKLVYKWILPKIFKYLAMALERFPSSNQSIAHLLTGYPHLFGIQLRLQCNHIFLHSKLLFFYFVCLTNHILHSDSVVGSLNQYNLNQQDALVIRMKSVFISKRNTNNLHIYM